MSEELKSVGAITLFVEDLARARSFYLDVFGRPVAFEDDSSAGFKLDNVVTVPAARAAIDPAAVAGPGSGSRCLLSIWVEDVDAACAELARKGVALVNGPVDRPWGAAHRLLRRPRRAPVGACPGARRGQGLRQPAGRRSAREPAQGPCRRAGPSAWRQSQAAINSLPADR